MENTQRSGNEIRLGATDGLAGGASPGAPATMPLHRDGATAGGARHRIAIIGAGAVGSAFGFQLARAGHEVTMIARGKRLEQLIRDRAIVTTSAESAPVQVREALDPSVAFDLVLVTVLASQVDDLLPVLASSAAQTVMFMFNYFAPLGRLRSAVGPARFAFGFPAVLARLEDGRLASQFYNRGIRTTVTDRAWATVLSDAGVHSVVHPDIEGWLHCHAAFMVPLMIAAVLAYGRGTGVSWRQAIDLARALDEGFRVVRELGHAITPAPIALLSRMPVVVMALFLWTASRAHAVRQIGVAGAGEARSLLDAMTAAARSDTPALRAVRP
jgi:2-dehydropantoate 2-reductase